MNAIAQHTFFKGCGCLLKLADLKETLIKPPIVQFSQNNMVKHDFNPEWFSNVVLQCCIGDGDSGNYTCEASNQGVATFYSNLTFQLVVQLPPTITAPPITQVAVLQSNSISLTCGASGYNLC
ncbi:hypothetical protein EMCRGX_G025756 [Ephydatia muelleri]